MATSVRADVATGIRFLLARKLAPESVDEALEECLRRIVECVRADPSGLECLPKLSRRVMTTVVGEYRESGFSKDDAPSALEPTGSGAVLEALKPRDVSILTAFYVREQDEHEIAREYGLTVGVIRSLKDRVRSLFAELVTTDSTWSRPGISRLDTSTR